MRVVGKSIFAKMLVIARLTLLALVLCAFPGCIPEDEGVLSFNTTSIKVPNVRSTQRIQVVASGNWLAFTEQTWVTFINNKGSGDGEIALVIDANNSAGERAASIAVQSDDVSGIRVIVITQPKGAPSLTVGRTEVTFPAPSSTTDTVKIITTLSWKISSDQTWLRPGVTSGIGTTVVTLKADALDGLTKRTGTITVQSKDDAFKRTISVTQNPKVKMVAGAKRQGIELTELSMPSAVYVSGNSIYVADQFNNRIVRWTDGGTAGLLVAGGLGLGDGLDHLSSPSGLSVLTNGDVLVADYGNNRVVRWNAGASVGELVAGGNGIGINLNQVVAPTSVFATESGEIFITESAIKRVTKWAPAATIGAVVAWEDAVAKPTSVFVDSNQNVYVSSETNDDVTMWKPDGTHVVVAGGNGEGSNLNQLHSPSGIFVDGEGNVYISDKLNHRVVKWAPGSEVGVLIAAGNGPGSSLDQLNEPAGIWVDDTGNIFVADQKNHRVVKWLAQ